MAKRGWMTGAIVLVMCAAAHAGCSSDSEAPPAAAGTGGSSGGDAAAEKGGGAGTILPGGSGGSAGNKSDASTDGDDASAGCVVKNLDFGKDCNECGSKKCCDLLTGCDNDPICVNLMDCVLDCPVTDAGVIDTACVGTCAGEAGFSNYYNPLVMCLADTDGGDSCGDVCPF